MVPESKMDMTKQEHFFGKKLTDQKQYVAQGIVVKEEATAHFYGFFFHASFCKCCGIPLQYCMPVLMNYFCQFLKSKYILTNYLQPTQFRF